ncbi:MAG: hypothetical protein NT029_11680 [Armatimonadetes bacterium]|nr:hypothetical protein [Armatimonadota bacterium]
MSKTDTKALSAAGRETTANAAAQTSPASPDATRITKAQAARLASMAGLPVAEIREGTIGQIAEKFKWRIDPDLLRFRRVCGQVVKKDPATGVEYPVPHARVDVEDTDCHFLTFAPPSHPWVWHFPFWSHREVIGSTTTDACGRFCVWVPAFDIDWVLRWRAVRHCYPILFRKPTIWDIIEHLIPPELIPQPGPWPPIRWPGPDPDPLPFLNETVLQHLEPLLGRNQVAGLRAAPVLKAGAQASVRSSTLDQPAFAAPIPPPLPEALAAPRIKGASAPIAESLGVTGEIADLLGKVDASRWIGPFVRCHTHIVPVWQRILDVPDITIKVSQDVDGDGDLETIYSEGFGDVRWDSGSIPDVKIIASPVAIASPLPADSPMCGDVEVPCKTPAIVLAGLYPLHNLPSAAPYIDNGTGYAQRPNPPHPTADPAIEPPLGTASTAPFAGVLQLYGCNERENAKYYRLRYTHQPPGGVESASVVFKDLTWPLWRWVGAPGHLEGLTVTPDADGWYDILPVAAGWMPARLLLNWPSGAPGVYKVQMEFATAGKALIAGSQTSPIRLYVDNSAPTAMIAEIRWRAAGETGWNGHPALSRTCAIVHRPHGVGLEFRVAYQASALHLRDMILWGTGCGGGALNQLAPTAWSDPASPASVAGVSQSPYTHWHTGPFDNNITRSAIFTLGAASLQGAYDFSLRVNSRAFSPAGGDGGFGPADWQYDCPSPVYSYDYWKFAVIDA